MWAVNGAGNAQLDTAQKVFGTASGYFDNNQSSYISTPNHADFSFGTGAYTIDFRVRIVDGGNANAFLQLGAWNNGVILWSTGSQLSVYEDQDLKYFSWSPSSNTWYHVAVIRNDSMKRRVFINGSQIGVEYTSSTNIQVGSSSFVGRYFIGNAPMYGWIEGLRISKGVARWWDDFTPPSLEYGMES